MKAWKSVRATLLAGVVGLLICANAQTPADIDPESGNRLPLPKREDMSVPRCACTVRGCQRA
jgi:hypothetical protein